MGRRKLYGVNPPIPIRDEFMSHPDFVVYDDVPGTKVAAFLEDATVEDRIALFRKAGKLATSDLGEAYAELKRSGEDGAEEEDEEPDADDYADDFVFSEGERMEEENA